MNPLQQLEALTRKLLISQTRTELYVSGLFSIELARIGLLSPEMLVDIIDNLNQSIAESIRVQEELMKGEAEKQWPVKNLAA